MFEGLSALICLMYLLKRVSAKLPFKEVTFSAVNQRGKIAKAEDFVVWPKVGAVNKKKSSHLLIVAALKLSIDKFFALDTFCI